ncbi:MAG TPA: T9SS type A sorting domain-containing protein, partial [Candidatus Marinimicrobia bacterium]|nr:T9SS type A sorting domain-containing protein [Candidatus Neomarinimicrobiota bacterium]
IDSSWYGANNSTPHPDGDALYGSFREYYLQQSMGEHDIVGVGQDSLLVLNPDSAGTGYPLWVVLDSSKNYYLDISVSEPDATINFHRDVINAFAAMMNDEPSIDTTGITKWVIIYTGNVDYSSSLRPGAYPASTIYPDPPDTNYPNFKDYYVQSEVWSNSGSYSNPSGFTHIGQQVHEFGHLLGAVDEYFEIGTNTFDPFKWALMSFGIYNGPTIGTSGNSVVGSCPAGFSPPYRVFSFDWIPVIDIENDTALTIHYDYSNPKYYNIDIPGSHEYFILENRLREGFDEFTAIPDTGGYSPSGDPNGAIGGLLIWHADSLETSSTMSDFIEIEFANNDPYHNNVPPDDWFNYYGHPFPYGSNDQDFNDNTAPSSNKRDGSNSNVSFQGIKWNSSDSSTFVYIIIGQDSISPATPQNLTLTNEGGNPRLRWAGNNTEPDLKGYNLYKELSKFPPGALDTLVYFTTDTTYLDQSFKIGGSFPWVFAEYWVQARDFAGNESGPSNSRSTKGKSVLPAKLLTQSDIPEEYRLAQNYPNPFNPVTTIKYDLPEDSFVHLDIYDLLGREVKTLLNEVVKAGYKVVSWEGKDNNGNPVSTGMYIYRLTVNSAESNEGILVVRKMVLLR